METPTSVRDLCRRGGGSSQDAVREVAGRWRLVAPSSFRKPKPRPRLPSRPSQSWPAVGPCWCAQAVDRVFRPTAQSPAGAVWPSVGRASTRDVARLTTLVGPGLGTDGSAVVTSGVHEASLERIVPHSPTLTPFAVLTDAGAPSTLHRLRFVRHVLHPCVVTLCPENPKTSGTAILTPSCDAGFEAHVLSPSPRPPKYWRASSNTCRSDWMIPVSSSS
jgi:hypothetical protein